MNASTLSVSLAGTGHQRAKVVPAASQEVSEGGMVVGSIGVGGSKAIGVGCIATIVIPRVRIRTSICSWFRSCLSLFNLNPAFLWSFLSRRSHSEGYSSNITGDHSSMDILTASCCYRVDQGVGIWDNSRKPCVVEECRICFCFCTGLPAVVPYSYPH